MQNQMLNISISLADIFVEGEDHSGLSFSEAIRNAIISEATTQVRKMTTDLVNALVREDINKRLDVIVPAMIEVRLENIHTTESFKNQYGSDTNLSQMIISKIQHTNFDRVITEAVITNSKKYADEIKKTYDSRFAAGIVEGLNKHSLLNADAAKVLLSQ